MALPYGTTGSLSPTFVPARPIGLAVKQPVYLYARCPIANRAEATFGLLRYLLGGDRPNQTAHLARSPARIHGPELEFKHDKGGVSSATPPDPRVRLHGVPPTLRMSGLNPIPSCS